MNAFGSSTKKFALVDPREIRDARVRFGREPIQLLDRANSIHCPTGRWPTRGWLLLARKDYDQLDTYSTALQLEVGDVRLADNVGTLRTLSVVQAQCVTRGVLADEDAVYLVEVTDGRGVLANEWFKFPATTSYNIRAPAYPQTFHPGSMNGGTTWTWSTMLQDLWSTMGSFLGSWPGLPSTPTGTPEGFWMQGIPAWPALCDVLEYLGMTVKCDLRDESAPFTIVNIGATDSDFTEAQARYATNLEDDLEWIDTGAGRVPKTVEVLFRRRNAFYGTEETVTYRNDAMANQWAMTPLYSVSVTAPATFSSAVGTHHLWADFTVRHDHNGDPLAEDVVTAAAIASERVTQYFNVVYSQTHGSMTQLYSGALPFSTGSQVDCVQWQQDFSRHARHTWRTKVMRGGHRHWLEQMGLAK